MKAKPQAQAVRIPQKIRAQDSLLPQSMGLPDTSPVPKKDQMEWDYVPVYADEEAGAQADKPKEDSLLP